MDPEARPTTIHTEDPQAPRAPWSFLQVALPGGLGRWGWGLMLGWVLVVTGPALGWAGHLRRAAGWSALPTHWGEQLSARDIWELWQNGGIQHRLTNSPTVHLFGMGLIIVLWCGWRLQAETAGTRATLGPWLLGALDTLLIGVLPLGLVAWGLDASLAYLGRLGITGLGWTAFIGRPLVWMAFIAALNIQWWLCRLGWTERLHAGWRRHLKDAFLALWSHPVQWGALALGGAAARAIPPFLVLLLAWRMGGGTSLRVWTFLLLQVLVTLLNGWILGWLLRAAALYWRHDHTVRGACTVLEEAADEA